jgi:hypothetical protein
MAVVAIEGVLVGLQQGHCLPLEGRARLHGFPVEVDLDVVGAPVHPVDPTGRYQDHRPGSQFLVLQGIEKNDQVVVSYVEAAALSVQAGSASAPGTTKQ